MIDFQVDLDRLQNLFSNCTNLKELIDSLSAYSKIKIKPKTTLIAFDEIQLCEKALNFLRFFKNSGYKVLATGSQLGISLGSSKSKTLPFPSDVKQINLYPMDFEEFAIACNEQIVIEQIRDSFSSRKKYILHNEAMNLYYTYVVTGGMPAVVSSYIENKNFTKCRQILSEIDNIYMADMSLHAPKGMVVQILNVWKSLPAQLARESSKKFKYSDVAKNARKSKYRVPLAWLESAGLVYLNYQTSDVESPLIANKNGKFFKVYMCDTGLMFYKYGLEPIAFIDNNLRMHFTSRFRGAIAENYVKQALEANNVNTFYWAGRSSS